MGDIISRKYVLDQLDSWQAANSAYENAEAYNLIGVFKTMIEQVPDAKREMTVEDILIAKGIRFSGKGLSYLVTAIASATGRGPKFHMMDVYGDVAALHHTNVAAAERAMRHALRVSGWKLTVKEFIAMTIYELERAGK